MNAEKCPDCGGEVRCYHDTEQTRIICKKKCNGYKVIKIKTISRKESEATP